MTTGEVNHVGPLRTMQLGALVYDADSQRLFTSTSGLGLFYEVDPVLGALTFLGDGFRRVSMLCDIPGSTDLYALRFDPVFNWLLFLGRADTDLPYPIEASFGFLTSLQISSIEMVVLPSGQ